MNGGTSLRADGTRRRLAVSSMVQALSAAPLSPHSPASVAREGRRFGEQQGEWRTANRICY
jgi:hypothetical protein